MTSGSKFSDSDIQKIVMFLDSAGWEQRGDGLTFYNPKLGETKKFVMWLDVYNFVMKLYGKDGK